MQDLTQAQLDQLIGNESTLLPEGYAPDTDQPWHVWSCWEQPPDGLEHIVATTAGPSASEDERAALRADFLCGRQPRYKTGTSLPLDKPHPDGHPLSDY